MSTRVRAPRALARMFVTYAVISLVPVLLLGLVLAHSLRSEARARTGSLRGNPRRPYRRGATP
jgi:hypothetical protein